MTWKVDQKNIGTGLTNDLIQDKIFSFGNTSAKESIIENAQSNALLTNVTPQYNKQPGGDKEIQTRAENLSKVFSDGGLRRFDQIAPYLNGLSADDLKLLQSVYKKSTGRELLMDADNYLVMEDRFRAFQMLAPERIHNQKEPLGMNIRGTGIKMDPPTTEVLSGSQVKYTLELNNEIGNKRISHLIKSENAHIEEEGASFTGDYSNVENDKNYRVTFQVRYGNDLPEFYTYGVTVRNAETKASNELGKLEGTAPDSELYLTSLDGQITDIKQAISELQIKREAVFADIQNSIGNSADKYTELRGIDKQLELLKSKLPELETARTNVADALNGGYGKTIPLKAVLIAQENGQTIPLQLYAKDLGGGKWAIVDVTNPSKPRTWTGEGILPADALNRAWKNFVNGTNDLPAGQIAAVHPPGLGFQENANWNAASSGRSSLKAWSNGLGAGSIALAVLGGAAFFGPGTQPLAVPLLLSSGVLGGISAGTNAADRINNGTFKWKSAETALDMLGIAGGIAGLGGLGAMTGTGRAILANGAKFMVQNLGNVTRIIQIADRGANVAGGILIANQYVEAIDTVNRSSMSDEQKTIATRQIWAQAIAAGGLIILGVGISTKMARAAGSSNFADIERNWLNKEIKVGDPLPAGYHWNGGQIHRNKGNVEANFAKLQVDENGRIDISSVERLSNPNLMNKNFLAKLKSEFTGKGLSGQALETAINAEKNRVQIHHIIPDELIQKTGLGKAAQKAGYNLDEADNLIGLARKAENKITPDEIGHWTSHPDYTLSVRNKLDEVEKLLLKRYKTLDKVPPDVIKQKMREVENEFRRLIEKNDKNIPTKDGRLSFAPTDRLRVGGRYEVRA